MEIGKGVVAGVRLAGAPAAWSPTPWVRTPWGMALGVSHSLLAENYQRRLLPASSIIKRGTDFFGFGTSNGIAMMRLNRDLFFGFRWLSITVLRPLA
ncbi:MAG: hypothetical protein RLZZ374_645 [Cyanobacteriota bacterium]